MAIELYLKLFQLGNFHFSFLVEAALDWIAPLPREVIEERLPPQRD